MTKRIEIKWLDKPEEHDYPAALSYLCLVYRKKIAAGFIQKMKAAPITQFKAKDIFRASGLSLVGISNAHVVKDQRKIESGQAISPLLMVRDSVNGKVVIADGYHRLCAVYSYNEDAVIPCKIV